MLHQSIKFQLSVRLSYWRFGIFSRPFFSGGPLPTHASSDGRGPNCWGASDIAGDAEGPLAPFPPPAEEPLLRDPTYFSKIITLDRKARKYTRHNYAREDYCRKKPYECCRVIPLRSMVVVRERGGDCSIFSRRQCPVSVVPKKAKLSRQLKVSLQSTALVITLGIDRTLS